MVKISQGNDAVYSRLKECQHEGKRFIAPSQTSAFDWYGYTHKHDKWTRNYGLKEEARISLGLPEFWFNPILLEDETSCLLLHEYRTKDRGVIPVWPFELTLLPTYTSSVFELGSHLLNGRFNVVPEGRPDCVVTLKEDFSTLLDSFSNRVRSSVKKSSALLKTIEVPVDDAPSCDTFKSLIHGTTVQYVNTTCGTSYTLTDIPVEMIDDDNTPYISQLGVPYRVFDTYLGDVWLARSYILEKDTEWFWVSSLFNRTVEADVVCGSRINRVTSTLVSLMNCASLSGLTTFNLGIDTFPYKHDFYPEIRYSSGLEAL